MTCAYCRRPIPRKDVAARLYNRSRATGLHFCVREDCIRVGKRLIAADLAATEVNASVRVES